ncbi:MAG TPA: hypothetical protein VFW40_10850 [Capsulimonadaceae bacterium]|nr:hypothetical protein [Capsulimonadaceae bacterium]
MPLGNEKGAVGGNDIGRDEITQPQICHGNSSRRQPGGFRRLFGKQTFRGSFKNFRIVPSGPTLHHGERSGAGDIFGLQLSQIAQHLKDARSDWDELSGNVVGWKAAPIVVLVLVEDRQRDRFQARNIDQKIVADLGNTLEHLCLDFGKGVAGAHFGENLRGQRNQPDLRKHGRQLLLPHIGRGHLLRDKTQRLAQILNFAEEHRIRERQHLHKNADRSPESLIEELSLGGNQAILLRGAIQCDYKRLRGTGLD